MAEKSNHSLPSKIRLDSSGNFEMAEIEDLELLDSVGGAGAIGDIFCPGNLYCPTNPPPPPPPPPAPSPPPAGMDGDGE